VAEVDVDSLEIVLLAFILPVLGEMVTFSYGEYEEDMKLGPVVIRREGALCGPELVDVE